MRRFYKLLIVIILSVAILITWLTIKSVFKIKKIIISSPYENMRGLNVFDRKSLFQIAPEKIIKELMENNSNIEKILLTKEYPNIIRLDIVMRQAVAKLRIRSSEIGVDKEGRLLFGMPDSESNIPRIEITDSDINMTGLSDWRISKVAKILHLVTKECIEIEQINFHDGQSLIYIYLPEGTQIIVPYSIDPNHFAASLQVIIHRFRIEGKNISKIDFRFEKPIVQLVNEEKNSSIKN